LLFGIKIVKDFRSQTLRSYLAPHRHNNGGIQYESIEAMQGFPNRKSTHVKCIGESWSGSQVYRITMLKYFNNNNMPLLRCSKTCIYIPPLLVVWRRTARQTGAFTAGDMTLRKSEFMECCVLRSGAV
jgi:hypothetical protein